jgi:hypothetical protein
MVHQGAAVLTACVVGLIMPVLATIYDGVYRHYHGSIDLYWKARVFEGACFVGLGSAVVGLPLGILGVLVLHRLRRSSPIDYIMVGTCIGISAGLLFCIVVNTRSDPAVSWFVFTILPGISMGFGFAAYWLVGIRRAARN